MWVCAFCYYMVVNTMHMLIIDNNLIIRLYEDGLTVMQIRNKLNKKEYTCRVISEILIESELTIIKKSEERYIVVPSIINFNFRIQYEKNKSI